MKESYADAYKQEDTEMAMLRWMEDAYARFQNALGAEDWAEALYVAETVRSVGLEEEYGQLMGELDAAVSNESGRLTVHND